MKKGLLIAVVGMLLMWSCEKDDIPELPDMPILGKWYVDTYYSRIQKTYTSEYKQYCQEHDSIDVTLLDEESHDRSDIHYAYRVFSPTLVEYYIQYSNGAISEGSVSYKIKDGKLFWGTSRVYTILELDQDNMKTQRNDTTYFYDDNDDKKVACVKTYTSVFSRKWYSYPRTKYDSGE